MYIIWTLILYIYLVHLSCASFKLMPRMMHINYCLCNTHMLMVVHSLEESVTTVRTLQRNVHAQACAYCTQNLLLHLLIVCQIGNVL
jgi:hypothetical protein